MTPPDTSPRFAPSTLPRSGPAARPPRPPGAGARLLPSRRGGRLDPSGVVKGWAADRAAAHLAQLPDTDFCLSAGGDLTCRTLNPDDPPWRIGIEDPHDPRRLVAVVPVHTGAVATSGTARRGAHVLDARTGRAPSGIASVTVIGTSLTDVDIDATAAFARGPDAARWLDVRGRTALIVRTDGSTVLLSHTGDG
ncbi:FAD:protein FMN transferase [Pseudonocardia sp. T1-2H]|uniref:FAD:protein FMN transferase n=1 Tax=Pseudonocardia sp. T1-2H TaxID=3128899 RepID=UPI004053BC9E